MSFIGLKSILVPMQFLEHYSFIAIFIFYFSAKTEGYDFYDMIFPVVSVLTRSLIIAIRYSFMSNSRYSVMKLKNPLEWVFADLIVMNWDRISFNSINQEINASIYRLKVEEDDFDFTFLKPLSHEYHNKLSNWHYYEEKNLKMKEVVKEIEVLRKNMSKNKASTVEPQTTRSLTMLNNTQKNKSLKEDKKEHVISVFTFSLRR